MMSHMTETAEK